jgi:hypothetical protein
MVSRKMIVRSAILFVAAAGCAFLINAQSIPKAGADFTSITSNGAWTWYGNPDAVYYEGKYKKTYIGWISNSPAIFVASYDHETGAIITKQISTCQNGTCQNDDHSHPSLSMRPDGRLMVFFSGHDGGIMSLYISTSPEDISSFDPPIQVAPGVTYCYPNPMWLSAEGDSGRLYLFYRSLGLNPCFSYSDDWGKTWTATKQYYSNPDGTPKPYANYCCNGKDEIHIVIEKGHRAGYCPLYYLKYKNGTFWKVNGTQLATIDQLPIPNTKLDTVMDPAASQCHGSAWDIALDNAGRPVIVYDQFKDGNNHIYYYVRWTGTTWFKKQLVNSGATMGGEDGFAGGLTLDHENTGNIYMSRQVNGVHEIDRWTTSDGGTTWDSTAITRGSAKKNTRPCVPRNHKPYGKLDVVWMYGDYSSYGGGYNTAVKMYPVNETVTVRPSELMPVAAHHTGITVQSSGISFYLTNPGASSLVVYSINGKLVADASSTIRSSKAGQAFIPFSKIHRAYGAYLFEFNDGNSKTVQRLIVSR